jgi:hypothetical protein
MGNENSYVPCVGDMVATCTFPPRDLSYDEQDVEIIQYLAAIFEKKKGESTWSYEDTRYGYGFYPRWIVRNKQPVLDHISGNHRNKFISKIKFDAKLTYTVDLKHHKTNEVDCDKSPPFDEREEVVEISPFQF